MTAKYKTESKVLATNSERWDWTYTETKPDRIFAEIEHGYGNKTYTYTYYFRTEFRGEYIMPPPTAYFMYQPEIHAVGTYRKLIVH